jgi:hypothetical protein
MPRDQIGLEEMPVRQRRANADAEPMEAAPSAANFPGDRERGRANAPTEPIDASPGLADIQIGSAVRSSRGRAITPSRPIKAPPTQTFGAEAISASKPTATTLRSPISVPAVVNKLVERQASRSWLIKAQQACDRRVESFIAAELGFSTEHEEKQRKAVFAQAKKVRADIEKKGKVPDGVAFKGTSTADIMLIVAVNMETRKEWDRLRDKVESEMIVDAMNLPVWPFVKTIAGFSEKGLAVITGEAGVPIGDYRTVSGLWKRMGLAVIDGKSQRRVKGKRGTDEERKRLAYVPRRRAECWTFADSLLRAQMCSEIRAVREAIKVRPGALAACEEAGIDIDKMKKVDDALAAILDEQGIVAEGYPTGPYGEVYVRRKQHTTPRIAATKHLPDKVGEYLNQEKWSPMRCHRDAARVMFKELLKDLWVEWRRVERMPLAAE